MQILEWVNLLITTSYNFFYEGLPDKMMRDQEPPSVAAPPQAKAVEFDASDDADGSVSYSLV